MTRGNTMTARSNQVAGGALAAAALALLTACSGAGDLSVRNGSDATVKVHVGGGLEDSVVEPNGGVVFLGYGCSKGDVTIELAPGRTEAVPGPVCPDEEIVIRRDGTVAVQPVAQTEN
ncbi:hypothetical protein ATL41_2603 [Flavimobilis soli]|uniref:NusG domain-containing protein n=2 Tax=Flavimobilis soli TaxID=442709 RepID=A0A2A9EG58_9MICO|nr:hypothetical protein ATL41_2603 [Flavimobilis soli]